MPLHGAERYPIWSQEEPDIPGEAPQPAWRSEVASRVSSYRARHHVKADTPALDFGSEPIAQTPEEDASWRPLEPLPGQRNGAGSVASATAFPKAAHTPFDTDYYRRRNAESFQPPAVSQGTLAPSMPVAPPVPDLPLSAPESLAPAANDLLDLDLRPASAENSALDRYTISPAEEQNVIPAEPEPRIPVQAPEPEPSPELDNLIVFRRPLIEPPLAPEPKRDELAEPMFSRPRILDVPEEIMPPVQGSLFPDIQLDADPESQALHEPEIALPVAAAPVFERLMAGLVDAGIVAAAGVLFAGIAYFALPDMPHTKPFFLSLVAVAVLLWAVYQHLFLLCAGQTPGMAVRRIHLRSFEGHLPDWSARGARARFMFLSLASVLLGFVWALVDEKALCWHDRVSHTFPVLD